MSHLLLNLVEYLIKQSSHLDLSDTKIIGAQHILETTHSMFRSLYQLGLKPSNVALIGKCYSTCEEVYNEMLSDGIAVWKGSTVYSSHRPYDEQYKGEVEKFLTHHLNEQFFDNANQIIVLDDGGKCIDFLSKTNLSISFVAIEQTSAGFEAIKHVKLLFPVINVARSPTKLKLESPMIAEAAAERLYSSLHRKNLRPRKALILGGGAIGDAMKKRLETDIEICIYDQQTELSTNKNFCFPESISDFPLIIGCTGTKSIPKSLHGYLPKNGVLVSVSSSDREFDAVELRKNIQENSVCHKDLLINGMLLVNSGFPVNFDGERENIHPNRIQLTIALITAGILQAKNISKSLCDNFIIPLCEKMEKNITIEYLKNFSNALIQ